MVKFYEVNSGYLEIEKLDNQIHHAHDEYVITLMLSGFVTLKGDSTMLIKPGTLTLVPSGFPHRLLQGNNMSVLWLSFNIASDKTEQDSPQLIPFEQIRQGGVPSFQLQESRIPFAKTLFSEIKRELSNNKSDIVLNSLINLLLNEAISTAKVGYTNLGNSNKVGKAIEFIERNCSSPISLKDVALSVHMSPAHLTTKMKQLTGYTVGQWILKYKLKMALDLLKSTDLTIDQITHKLGWNDVTYFIRQFKTAFQATPAAWRKQYIENPKLS